MSKLPSIPLASGSFTEGPLAGLEYHAISAATALKVEAADRERRGVLIIAMSLDISEEEAQAWLEATPMEPATELLNAIVELSGLDDQVTVGSKA